MRQAKAVKSASKQQKELFASNNVLLSDEIKHQYDQYPFLTAIVHQHQFYANRTLQLFLNLSESATAIDFSEKIHPEDRLLFTRYIEEPLNEELKPLKIRLIHKNQFIWFMVDSVANQSSNNSPDIIFNFTNIHELEQQNIQIKDQLNQHLAQLNFSSEKDTLTGLYNRQGLKNILVDIIDQSKVESDHIGVMLIGLDHFKNINDTMGYHVGDYVLSSFAELLKDVAPQNAIIGRLGSDEFAVVVPNVENIDNFKKISQQILNLSHVPISYKNKILRTGMSIGCSFYPQDGSSLSELLQCADTALSDLKTRGRGGIRFFNQEMFNVTRNKAIQLETAHNILRANMITPYYQPKVELTTGKLIGLEALLRWHCPETNKMFMPETVTEAFNDFELATRISANIQHKVFQDILKWQDKGKQVVPVAINASPVEFFRDNYAETLLARLNNSGVSPEHIEVEITEHLFSDRGVEYVIRALKKLQAAGIKIALDDFGTGHSSLTHLRDLPVNYIKIDYSFIHKMIEEKPIAAIVEGIVKLGPLLDMKVIAEGIENQEQLKLLTEMGCHYGQGFLFKDAITQSEVLKLLDTQV